eukprot:TRINITY_DN12688_c0_g1_i5.p1 TRINITY_DN12688_c0_g1~~TRINITY_DN12688_c0_g1_i5.p1  ORF type:complete len:524 (+),score=127.91 TRINITY_DN12688_c0_g1_i5:125-1696(+)
MDTTEIVNTGDDVAVEEKIQKYVEGCNSADEQAQLEGTFQLRKLLSIERSPPIELVIASGVVPRLVELLISPSPRIVFEAAWALTNIASGTSQQTKVIYDSGAIPLFVQLMNHESDDVREQAVWALGNIAGDSAQYRNFVLDSGAMPPLLNLLESSVKATMTRNASWTNVPDSGVMPPLLNLLESSVKATMTRNATWTLSNLVRGKPKPSFAQVKPAVPVLAKLLESKDDEVLTDTCWALSYLSDSNDDNEIEEVICAGVCRRLVELLFHNAPSVHTSALRTLGNLVTGNDAQTQTVVNAGLLDGLLHLLKNNQKNGILKEACWTVSNITAGNKEQIEVVIISGLMDSMVEICSDQKAYDYDVKKEATWAIANAFAGASDSQTAVLVKKGCATAVCHLLNCPDVKIQSVCMEGVENVMRAGRKHSSNPYVDELIRCGAVRKLKVLCDGADWNWNNSQKAQTLLAMFDGYDVDVGEAEAEASPQLEFMLEGELGETEPGVASPAKHTKSRNTTSEETYVPGEFE